MTEQSIEASIPKRRCVQAESKVRQVVNEAIAHGIRNDVICVMSCLLLAEVLAWDPTSSSVDSVLSSFRLMSEFFSQPTIASFTGSLRLDQQLLPFPEAEMSQLINHKMNCSIRVPEGPEGTANRLFEDKISGLPVANRLFQYKISYLCNSPCFSLLMLAVWACYL